MKKVSITVALIIVVSLAVAGCKSGADKAKPATEEKTQTESTTEQNACLSVDSSRFTFQIFSMIGMIYE